MARTTETIAATLASELGREVSALRPVAGGDINDAYRAETDQGPLFVKTRAGAPAGSFAQEAAGLRWLGAPEGLAVPGVVLVHAPPAGSGPRFLALDWIDGGPLTAAGQEEVGRGLAAVHAAGAPAFGATPCLHADGSLADATGHEPSNLGELTLSNEPCATFAEFWAQRRILPLAERAHSAGALSADGLALMHRLSERLPQIAGPPEPPARTHGDLWSGNVMADRAGRPHLIDPVAHGGHREVDLATLCVFGGPGQRCFDAYHEVHPLADGHQDRVALWQLGIILVHVVLFGGAYAQQAIGLARHYV